MTLNLTIHAFNDGYPLYLFLNGLKHYFGSSDWSGLVFMAVSLLTLAGILAVKQVGIGGYAKAYAGPLLLYAAFFSQTATVNIQDEWSHEGFSVNGLPVAVALPLYVSTTLEKSMVDMVERHIIPPNMTKFEDFDFFMEAAALSEVITGKAASSYEVLANIDRYYEDCVLKGIATGFVNPAVYYRSADLLTDTYMPWGIYFTEIIMPDGTNRVLSCADAYNYMHDGVSGEAVSVGDKSVAAYLKSSMSTLQRRSVVDAIAAMDSLANSLFPGYQSTSDALFRQAFMINGITGSLAKSNPELLAAISKAEVAQATGIAAAAAIYIKKLPKLRAMTKMIIVGMVPFAAAAFLAQAGRPFLIWFAALMSVSFWLPIMCIIKATYIASAINELGGMVLPANGLTIPNKLRIMAWISDTSTVAGTLGLAIPAFASLLMQFVAPKLALALGALTMGTAALGTFAQRAGTQALAGAEKSAAELEKDKVAKMFLEAGDKEQIARSQMNQHVAERSNVAFGRIAGASPLERGTTTTNLVGGYELKGTSDSAESTDLSRQESAARQSVSQAAASAAYSASTGTSLADQTRTYEGIREAFGKSDNTEASNALSRADKIAEEVARSHNLTSSQAASLKTSVGIGASAGVSVGKSLAGLLNGNIGMSLGGKGDSTSTETKQLSDAAQEAERRMLSDDSIATFMKNQATSLSNEQSAGSENSHASGTTKQETWNRTMQRMQSEGASYAETKSRNDSLRASIGAGGAISASSKTMLQNAPVYSLERLSHMPGMENLNRSVQSGVHDIDSLRRMAHADMSTMLRQVDIGKGDARIAAVQNSRAALAVLTEANQLETATEAGRALNILDQREGHISTIKPSWNSSGEVTSLTVKNSDVFKQNGTPSTPTLSGVPEKPEIKQPTNNSQSFETQYKNNSAKLENQHIINSQIMDEQRREQARISAEENIEQVQNKNEYLNATDGALNISEQAIRRSIGFQPKK